MTEPMTAATSWQSQPHAIVERDGVRYDLVSCDALGFRLLELTL